MNNIKSRKFIVLITAVLVLVVIAVLVAVIVNDQSNETTQNEAVAHNFPEKIDIQSARYDLSGVEDLDLEAKRAIYSKYDSNEGFFINVLIRPVVDASLKYLDTNESVQETIDRRLSESVGTYEILDLSIEENNDTETKILSYTFSQTVEDKKTFWSYILYYDMSNNELKEFSTGTTERSDNTYPALRAAASNFDIKE